MNKIFFRILSISIFFMFTLISCTSNNLELSNDEYDTEEGYPFEIQDGDPSIGYPLVNQLEDPSIGYPEPVITKINPEEIKLFPTPPDPDPGLASLSAVLYTPYLSQIIPDTSFYLMPAIGENNEVPPIISGPDVNQGDVHGFTNDQGFLVLNNISPDLYYLVVWSPYTWTLAENKDGIPLLIEIISDSKNDLRSIDVPWP